MANIEDVQAGGEVLKGIELDFEIVKEQWDEYTLLDGGTIRMKTFATRIFRVVNDDGVPQFGPDGKPHVIVQHQTSVVFSS